MTWGTEWWESHVYEPVMLTQIQWYIHAWTLNYLGQCPPTCWLTIITVDIQINSNDANKRHEWFRWLLWGTAFLWVTANVSSKSVIRLIEIFFLINRYLFAISFNTQRNLAVRHPEKVNKTSVDVLAPRGAKSSAEMALAITLKCCLHLCNNLLTHCPLGNLNGILDISFSNGF